MPTYEYICQNCSHEWEAEQSIKEDPLTQCPKCQQSTAQRQISRGAGFILKGGGWYSDLYSSSSSKSDKSGTEASSSTKTESSAKDSASTPAAPTTATPSSSGSTSSGSTSGSTSS